MKIIDDQISLRSKAAINRVILDTLYSLEAKWIFR